MTCDPETLKLARGGGVSAHDLIEDEKVLHDSTAAGGLRRCVRVVILRRLQHTVSRNPPFNTADFDIRDPIEMVP